MLKRMGKGFKHWVLSSLRSPHVHDYEALGRELHKEFLRDTILLNVGRYVDAAEKRDTERLDKVWSDIEKDLDVFGGISK